VLLVSDSEALCAAARQAGAQALLEDRGDDLNAALWRAEAAIGPADALLVLPADLPRLEAGDIQAMAAAGDAAEMAIAPDRQETGTNALLWTRAPRAFRFGVDSFAAHQEAARATGAPVAVVRRPGLAFDLDLPADLAELRRNPPPWLADVLR
jgi:2-phospho-L-lactate guanylyltransferase